MARDGVGLLAFDSLGQGGPVGEALKLALAARRITPRVHRCHERATLHRQSGVDYHTGMRAHHRRELRRQRRRLEQQLGGPLAPRDRAGEPDAIEEFLRLEAAGWKGRQGTAFACSPSDAAFYRDLCRAFSEDGRLQLLALGLEGRTVAMKCNLLAGDAIFCFKIAFDEACAPWTRSGDVKGVVISQLLMIDCGAFPSGFGRRPLPVAHRFDRPPAAHRLGTGSSGRGAPGGERRAQRRQARQGGAGG